jgi:hypothetical protein
MVNLSWRSTLTLSSRLARDASNNSPLVILGLKSEIGTAVKVVVVFVHPHKTVQNAPITESGIAPLAIAMHTGTGRKN